VLDRSSSSTLKRRGDNPSKREYDQEWRGVPLVKRVLKVSFFHIFVKNQNIPLVTKDENPIKDLRGRCLPIKGEGEGLGIEWCLFLGERDKGRGMKICRRRRAGAV